MTNEYDFDGDMEYYQNQLAKKGITKEMLDMDKYSGLTARQLQNIVDSAYIVPTEEVEKMFKCEIKTGNAAFCNEYTGEEDSIAKGEELARIFDRMAKDIVTGKKSGVIMDFNGNKVGKWSLE